MEDDPERLDVIEPTGRLVGVESRDVVHRDGAWHQVVHCLVVRPGPPARVVLQVRSFSSGTYPGRLDLSVTGHVQAGESALDAMCREIVEELGIDVDRAALVPLGARLLAADHGDIRNRELMHVFLLADDRHLASYPLDPEHAGGLIEVETEALLRILADASTTERATAIDVAGVVTERRIRHDDLVPPLDGYWTVVTVMAERFVAGESPLAV